MNIPEIIAEIRASGFRRISGVGDIGCYDTNMVLALCDECDRLTNALRICGKQLLEASDTILELRQICEDNRNELIAILEKHGLRHELDSNFRLTDLLERLVRERDEARIEADRYRFLFEQAKA